MITLCKKLLTKLIQLKRIFILLDHKNRYASSIGYFEDPFIKAISKTKPKKMMPIINRGTWTRVHAYRKTFESFLAKPGDKQIISFGAGLDTSYFYLKYKYPDAKLKYIEVDFADIVTKKINIISKNPALAKFKEDTSYAIFACDLRDLVKLAEEFAKIKVDTKTQTLILTECVLVYIDPICSQELVNWCGKYFENAAMLNYEMINPFDSFGKMMVENIEVTPKFMKQLIGKRMQVTWIDAISDIREAEGKICD